MVRVRDVFSNAINIHALIVAALVSEGLNPQVAVRMTTEELLQWGMANVPNAAICFVGERTVTVRDVYKALQKVLREG